MGLELRAKTPLAELKRQASRRAGALDETLSRFDINSAAVALGVSGRLSLIGVVMLEAGVPVTTITVLSGSTAMVTPTNQWFTLVRVSDKEILGKTENDTNVAWGTQAEKALDLASVYTPPADTLANIGVVITAGTMPTLSGFGGLSVANGLAPILAGLANTGLTDPDSLASVGAIGGNSAFGYAYVS